MAENTFKAKVCSTSCQSSSRALVRRIAPPALLTSTSRAGERAATWLRSSRQPCSVERSACSSTASPPSPVTASAVARASAAEEW